MNDSRPLGWDGSGVAGQHTEVPEASSEPASRPDCIQLRDRITLTGTKPYPTRWLVEDAEVPGWKQTVYTLTEGLLLAARRLDTSKAELVPEAAEQYNRIPSYLRGPR